MTGPLPRFLSAVTVLSGMAAASPAAEPNPAARPNVLFLFADDQRADTIAAWGNRHIETPNLDKLVRRGFSFRNNYCFGSNSGAVCVPSRAMLMTGRTWFDVKPNLDGATLLPEVLREGGYATFATGKWHNGEPSFVRAFPDGAVGLLRRDERPHEGRRRRRDRRQGGQPPGRPRSSPARSSPTPRSTSSSRTRAATRSSATSRSPPRTTRGTRRRSIGRCTTRAARRCRPTSARCRRSTTGSRRTSATRTSPPTRGRRRPSATSSASTTA